jgi:hypothetical protein
MATWKQAERLQRLVEAFQAAHGWQGELTVEIEGPLPESCPETDAEGAQYWLDTGPLGGEEQRAWSEHIQAAPTAKERQYRIHQADPRLALGSSFAEAKARLAEILPELHSRTTGGNGEGKAARG